MCLRLIVKLVAVALLAGVAPTSANGKTMVGAVDGLTTHKGIALHNRMLRRVNDDEEERANWMTSLVTKFKDSRKVSAWVKQDLPSNQVLGLLKLHQTDKILEKPQFKLLESFVTKYNTKNPKNKLTVLDILTEKFGVDGVAKMLVSAKNVKSTETLAARMQGSQIAYYMRDGRNVNTFFHALKLGDDGFSALYSRKLSALKQYIDVYNHRNKEGLTLIKVLTENYGQRKLAGMIFNADHVAIKYPKIGENIRALKKEQFGQWQKNRIQPKDVLSKVFRLKNSDPVSDLDKAIVGSYSRFLKQNPNVVP